MCGWRSISNMERQIIQEFIEIYRSEPSLWKVRSCHYNNKTIKNIAYRRMVAKLRELYPNADVEMVKKKINALRTNYRKEVRKVEASRERSRQTGEPVYVPSLWYYELFHFIGDQENEPDVQEILQVDWDENVQYEGGESEEEAYEEEFQISSPESIKNSEHNLQMTSAESQSSFPPIQDSNSRKRKYESFNVPSNHHHFKSEVPPKPDSQEIFGQYIAS
ncbi:hypothetical protein X975_23194, partial [Stegodyphus mimosarum]